MEFSSVHLLVFEKNESALIYGLRKEAMGKDV